MPACGRARRDAHGLDGPFKSPTEKVCGKVYQTSGDEKHVVPNLQGHLLNDGVETHCQIQEWWTHTVASGNVSNDTVGEKS